MQVKKFKYPRTPHLPWSENWSSDDLMLQNTRHFEGREVIITEKLDGENTTMYTNYMHARSINYRPHASRDLVKQLHASISHMIPEGWRICGENMYAKHSISYENLEAYFYLFSIWDDRNECLDWQQTMEWGQLFNLKTPPEFYRGLWNEKVFAQLLIDTKCCEGYVVRTISGFSYEAFDQHVAKWVRKDHVTSDCRWRSKKVISNQLSPKEARANYTQIILEIKIDL